MTHLGSLALAALEATQERAARHARHTAKRGAVLVMSGVLFGMAAVFLSIAAFAALRQSLGPVAAGLIIGTVLALLGAVALLMAIIIGKREKTPIPAIPSGDAALEALKRDVGKMGSAGPIVALALGFFLSKR